MGKSSSMDYSSDLFFTQLVVLLHLMCDSFSFFFTFLCAIFVTDLRFLSFDILKLVELKLEKSYVNIDI